MEVLGNRWLNINSNNMKYMIQVLILVTIISTSSCNTQQPNIDVKKATLIDVRTPEEYREGTVPGAINIPLQEVEQRIADFTNKAQIVVFCRSGNRSAQAADILKKHGIQNVVDGGSWKNVERIVREQNNK